MQENQDQTVSFQPIGMDIHYPWFVNVFAIYLLCVLLMTFVRAGTLMWTLRKIQRVQKRDAPSSESDAQSFSETAYSTIRSIRGFSHLTFLLSVLVLGWYVTNILAGVSMENVSSFSSIAARFAEALIPFLMGIIFCCGLFGSAMFLESRVRHGRSMFVRRIWQNSSPGRVTGHTEVIRLTVTGRIMSACPTRLSLAPLAAAQTLFAIN